MIQLLSILLDILLLVNILNLGGDIWELRILLGHSSINSTMVYLHMAKDFNDVYSPLDGV